MKTKTPNGWHMAPIEQFSKAAPLFRYCRGEWAIEPALGGGWLLLFRGVQVGGDADRSGAGNMVFPTAKEAADFYANRNPQP